MGSTNLLTEGAEARPSLPPIFRREFQKKLERRRKVREGREKKAPYGWSARGKETNAIAARAYWKLTALTSGFAPEVTVMKAPMKPGAFKKSLVRPS
jgi:hypothetical protein